MADRKELTSCVRGSITAGSVLFILSLLVLHGGLSSAEGFPGDKGGELEKHNDSAFSERKGEEDTNIFHSGSGSNISTLEGIISLRPVPSLEVCTCSSAFQDLVLCLVLPMCAIDLKDWNPRKGHIRNCPSACGSIQKPNSFLIRDLTPVEGLKVDLTNWPTERNTSSADESAMNSCSSEQEDDNNENHADKSAMNSCSSEQEVDKNENHANDASHFCGTSSASLMNVTLELLNKSHHFFKSDSMHVRHERGDGPYNYASSANGAKILASTRDAIGASNILNEDRDKYLRFPCSVEPKYVDIELTEETLVVTVAIANHEFCSSSVKEFELWGSLVYPTEQLLYLGKFEAENTRAKQAFTLSEAHWVRFLRFQMLNHYGSDFYCTLSTLEVYGIDAIEWFLEDWIAEERGAGAKLSSKRGFTKESEMPVSPDEQANSEEAVGLFSLKEAEMQSLEASGKIFELFESYDAEEEVKNFEKIQLAYHQTGRPALDGVMKLLMQKVRSLEHKQLLVSKYIDDLNDGYKETLRSHGRDISIMLTKLEGITELSANLSAGIHTMEGQWIQHRLAFEKYLSSQVKAWNTELDLLQNQLKLMENKEMTALLVAFLTLFLACLIRASVFFLSLFNLNGRHVLVCKQAFWVCALCGCILAVLVLCV